MKNGLQRMVLSALFTQPVLGKKKKKEKKTDLVILSVRKSYVLCVFIYTGLGGRCVLWVFKKQRSQGFQ